MILEKLRLIIEESAKQQLRSDEVDFRLIEEVGGNLDDAYELGCQDGEVEYARNLLTTIDLLELGFGDE